MTSAIDVSIIILVLIIIYKFLFKKTAERYSPDNNLVAQQDTEKDKNESDPALKYIDKILQSKHKKVDVNPNFIEIQFHQDYRDTSNAFILMSPNQKEIFNKGDLPIKIDEPSYDETKKIVKKFIKEVNRTVKYHVSSEDGLKNWQNHMTDKKFKSGWDKQQEALGLPTSIYLDPAEKASIKLIKLDHAEKHETDDEIKYVVFLIIQKKNVNDQMLVRVSFVVEKRDLNLDREFFSKKNSYETSVKIEEIFIIGFLTKQNTKVKTKREKFYKFDTISDGRMFSRKDIIKELNKKRKEYEKECSVKH